MQTLSIPNSLGLPALFYAFIGYEPSLLLFFVHDRYALHREIKSGILWLRAVFERRERVGFGSGSPMTIPPLHSFILNSDYDLTCCNSQWGNVFQRIGRGHTTSLLLQRLLRRVPRSDVSRLLNFRPQNLPTALYGAATVEQSPNIDLLVISGAKLELEGGECGTALMGACDAGRLENVKRLVRYGAKIEYRNSAGEVVGAITAAKYHPSIVRWVIVSRFTEQNKICQTPDPSSARNNICPWSVSKIVQVYVPKLRMMSQLEYLREANKE